MIKYLLPLLTCTLIVFSSYGQQKNYFQQDVSTTINVTLNDEDHVLEGNIEISYTNNSPDKLDFIYFHLWPNAYLDSKTAFGQQKMEDGSSKFYFSEEKHRGKIYDIDFTVDGKTASWELDTENPDIAVLNLPSALASGATIEIKTPFSVKIPKSVSRLGHVGQSYQMTQWYPKPAVYDNKGWHPMPYLDQGEFFSEFGTFDVTITLPKNYVVGATGELQTESEKQFLAERVKETESQDFTDVNEFAEFPDSDPEYKTIRYTAFNVHDFAWFADKRFHVLKGQVRLPSDKVVDTWVMFTDTEANLWQDAIAYVDRSVKFYSDKVGEYPYSHATAVQSALSAGAGMEYPMITVIGKSGTAHDLDIVITHEVGHNWFYGILASDERQHPWMDEGMNSYYEALYNKKYYNQRDELDYMLPKGLVKLIDGEGAELGYNFYLYQARKTDAQPIETPSQDLTSLNYFLSAYMRPAAALAYLAAYLGEDTFDKIMKKYYVQYQFKHPYPEDFRRLFEKETGKDLSWFFDGALGISGKEPIMDYALSKSGSSYKVVNKGTVAGPFSISTLKDGEIVATQWYEGIKDSKEVTIPSGDFDEVRLDAIEVIPETNRLNNGQKRKFKFQPLTSLENPKTSPFNFIPLVGYNHYDKFMVGLSLHNIGIPGKRLEYNLAPMFATGTKELVGMGDLKYHTYFNNGAFKRVTVGVGVKSFNHFENPVFDWNEKYYRIAPKLQLEFKKKNARSPIKQVLDLTVPVIVLKEGGVRKDTLGIIIDPVDSTITVMDTIVFDKFEHRTTVYPKLTYTFSSKQGLNPFSIKPSIEYAQIAFSSGNMSRVKIDLEANYKYFYKKGKAIKFRFYGATALDNKQIKPNTYQFPISLVNGTNADYTFEDYYFQRYSSFNGDNGGNPLIGSQQINNNQGGGFHNPVSVGSRAGASDKMAFSLHIKGDLPFKKIDLPIKPYFDVGVYQKRFINGGREWGSLAAVGIAVELWDVVGIYMPIVTTSDIKNRGGFFDQIGFKIDLHKANVLNLTRKFSL